MLVKEALQIHRGYWHDDVNSDAAIKKFCIDRNYANVLNKTGSW